MAAIFDSGKKYTYLSIINDGLTIRSQIASVGAAGWAFLEDAISGKQYAEFAIETFSSLVFAGVGGGASYLNQIGDGFCLRDGGHIYDNGAYQQTIPSLNIGYDGAIVQIAVDTGNNLIWFGVDGNWQGDPAAGTGGFSYDLSGKYFGAAQFINGSAARDTNLLATAEDQQFPSPAGFAPVGGSSGIASDLVVAEADDTVSGVGELAIAGTAASPETGDLLGASAQLGVSGSTGTIELDDALAGSGVVAGPGNAVALSEADDTISAASALRLVAGASNVEHGDIPAAEAVLTLSGVAPLIEQGDALFVLSQGTFLTPAGRTIGLSASRRQSRTIRPGASQLLQRTLSS